MFEETVIAKPKFKQRMKGSETLRKRNIYCKENASLEDDEVFLDDNEE